MPGWRFAFLSVAMVSFAIGGLTLAFGVEPRGGHGPNPKPREPFRLSEVGAHMAHVLSIRTFGIIVLQVRGYPAVFQRLPSDDCVTQAHRWQVDFLACLGSYAQRF